MPVLLILIAGLIVVIGGIVFARLPAFLSLTLGAILVAWLTPQQNLFEASLSQDAVQIKSITDSDVELTNGRLSTGDQLLIRPGLPDGSETHQVPSKATAFVADGGRIDINPESLADLQVGDVVSTREQADRAFQFSQQRPLQRVTRSMGDYFGRLAIIIVCASIIGRCLLDSGSAERIVRSLLNLLGQRLAPAALTASSFVLGIPVFFDTVFYLMIPIAKVLRMQTGAGYLLYVLAIVAGATMAHSLVPPTPGPLAVAEMFNVELGQMIIGGGIVGLVAACGGLAWAAMMNRFFTLNLPDEDTESLEQTAQKDESELPPLWVSLLPIVLPLLLISMKPLLETFAPGLDTSHPLIRTLSDKNIALLLSAGISLVVYLRTARPSREIMAAAMQSAIGSAGAILVIAAFLVTAGIRTAQGSATVAMMTAGGVFGPLVTSGVVTVAPLYMALAIGCGSKPISWMNDSGFWIVTRMSGMTETEGLKFISPLLTVMGIAGLLAVITGVILFPLT